MERAGGGGERAGDCAPHAGDSEWWCDVCDECCGHAPHAVLYAALYYGGCGGRALFARGVRAMLYVLEGMRCVLLCMLAVLEY